MNEQIRFTNLTVEIEKKEDTLVGKYAQILATLTHTNGRKSIVRVPISGGEPPFSLDRTEFLSMMEAAWAAFERHNKKFSEKITSHT